jgi:hypothetical protein
VPSKYIHNPFLIPMSVCFAERISYPNTSFTFQGKRMKAESMIELRLLVVEIAAVALLDFL